MMTVLEKRISGFENELVRLPLSYGRVVCDLAYTPCSSVRFVTAVQPKTHISILIFKLEIFLFLVYTTAKPR
jgi:hypothetical protein